MYENFILILMIYINVSAACHIKTLKPNVIPSVFTFIKNKSSEK